MDRSVSAAGENDALGSVLLGIGDRQFLGMVRVIGIEDFGMVAQIRRKRGDSFFQSLLTLLMDIRIHDEYVLQIWDPATS